MRVNVFGSWIPWLPAAAWLAAVACVGEDPAGAPPSATEAGTSSSGGSSGSSGTSGMIETDASSDAALDERCDPDAPFVRAALVPGLETTTVSDRVTLTADELQVFYGQTLGDNAPFSQVYAAVRSARTEPFPTPVLREDLSSPQPDYNPAISPDGTRLVLVSSRGGPYALHIATREDPLGAFGAATELTLGPTTNATSYAAPIIAADGSLHFARRGGTPAQYAQFRAQYTSGQYTSATAIPDFETAFDETDLLLASDGRHAFFSSDRPLPGTDGGSASGVSHVWQATRTNATQPWSAAVPLTIEGFDLATQAAFVGHVSVDGCRLYFQTGGYPNGRAFIAYRGR